MPRYTALPDDFFSRDYNNVMVNCKGQALLSSKNKISNPDLKDFEPDDDISCWFLDAPDRPTGWNVYVRRKVQSDPRMMRQNTQDLSLERDQYNITDALERGRSIPDPQRQSTTAPPDEIRAWRKARAGVVGFKARTWYLSYAWVVGKDPMDSPLVTRTAPVVSVATGQGQRIKVHLPQDVPEGVTGIAIYMGTTQTTLYEQRRIRASKNIPDSITLRGPYRTNTRLANAPDGTNRTKLGKPPAPEADRRRSNMNLDKGGYRLAYSLMTKHGWTPRSDVRVLQVDQDRKGQCVAWRPRRWPEGTIAWRPEFRGAGGNWYTIDSGRKGGRDGWPRDRWAEIHTLSTKTEDWKGMEKPYALTEDADGDFSGVDSPDAKLDPPTLVGDIGLTPGTYQVRTTFQVGERETGSSPVEEVTLPDEGGGVTNDIIVVRAPRVQKIMNERWADKGNDDIELEWEAPDVHGTTVTFGDGRLSVADTSGLSNDVRVRISSRTRINPAVFYTFRARLAVTRRVSGRGKIVGHWYNEAGSLIRSDLIEARHTVGVDMVRVTFGPQARHPDFRIPASAAFFAVSFNSDNNPGGTRNLDWNVSQIGLSSGAHARKRWPLHLGLYNDREDTAKKTSATEDEAIHYPPGAYCRVVENPTDGPRVRGATVLHETGFEDQTLGGWNSDGTVAISGDSAIHGDYGASITASGTNLLWRSYTGRSRVSIRSFMRIRQIGSSAVNVIGVTNSASYSDFIARARINPASGDLTFEAKNGASTATQTIDMNIFNGGNFRFELEVVGVGTGNGQAHLYWKRGDASTQIASFTSMNFSSLSIDRVWTGVNGGGGTMEYDLDSVASFTDGERDTDALDTNYVEYWAPEGTRYEWSFGMSGMRVPVAPNTQYTFSAYVGAENCAKTSWVLYSNVLDADGKVILENDWLTALKGDEYWHRPSKTFTTPENAAYFEVAGNWIADGLIRIGALQLEEGTLTAWDNTNASTGYFTVVFDTNMPGGAIAEQMMNRVVEWVYMDSIENNEEDEEGNVVTSVDVDIRSGHDIADLDANPWRPDLDTLLANEGMRRYAELKVTLNTTDLTQSPNVRAAYIDVKRPLPMLYRPNGDDFRSGVLVHNLPAPKVERQVVEREYASGDRGFAEVGRKAPKRFFRGFSLEAFRDWTAEEITNRQGHNDGTFIIEARDKRWVVRFFNASFVVDRAQHRATGSKDGFWRHRAEGVEAEILEEADF